jgi:hypothetical protein
MGFAYLTGGSAYQTGVIRGDFVIEKIFTTPENFASPGAVEQVQ